MTAATSRLRRRGIGAGVAALVGLTGLGFAAVPAQADANFALTRPADTSNRYATAASVATAAFTTSTNVIIANGDNAVDALAASYLGGTTTPILYVNANSVPAATAAAITKLGATNAWVVGGTTAIPASVYAAIGTTTKSRIDGADRYKTAVAVGMAAATVKGTNPTTAFIARGDAYADALAIAPYAAKAGIPVLLTQSGSLNADTLAALKAWGITNVTVVGGTTAVSADVVASLTANGVTSSRIEGATRTETAVKIANTTAFGFGKSSVYLVNGLSPVDALPASIAAAKANAPIILTSGTTLGTDAAGYLSANANSLTTGVAVGGTTVLPTDLETAAETAAQMTTANIVLTVPNGTSFTYADPMTKAAVTATYAAGDTFTVDGVNASAGVFAGAITPGDKVVVSAGTGTTKKYDLTNVNAATTYLSGLVGSGSTATSVNIAEPVTGATINTINLGATSAYNLYQLNGVTSTAAAFAANINAGDTVTVTGTGADASNLRTVNLVDTSVTGVVTAKTSTNVSFKLSTGAVLTTGTITDGATKTSDSVNVPLATDFLTAVTVGDSLTYSKTGGVSTLALVNAASVPYTGIASSTTSLTNTQVFVGTALTASPTFDATGAVLTVDGARVTAAEFSAALTAGDQLTVKVPDGQIDAVGSVALTNKTLSGPVGTVDTTADTVSIFSAAGVAGGAALAVGVNYNTGNAISGNTANTYFVNGTSSTLAQFETALTAVGNGSSTGTVELTDNGVTTEWRLATAAVTAAPTATTALIASNTTSNDTVTLNFSKPVYFSQAPATGDITINGTAVAITSVSPTFSGTAANAVTIATGANTFNASGATNVSVVLTAQGAAKVKDANGVSVAAATTLTVATVS